jgi:hypothetical protein
MCAANVRFSLNSGRQSTPALREYHGGARRPTRGPLINPLTGQRGRVGGCLVSIGRRRPQSGFTCRTGSEAFQRVYYRAGLEFELCARNGAETRTQATATRDPRLSSALSPPRVWRLAPFELRGSFESKTNVGHGASAEGAGRVDQRMHSARCSSSSN